MWHEVLLIVLFFHFGEYVANNLTGVFFNSDLRQVGPRHQVVHPVAHVIIFGQVEQITLLHLDEVCNGARTN